MDEEFSEFSEFSGFSGLPVLAPNSASKKETPGENFKVKDVPVQEAVHWMDEEDEEIGEHDEFDSFLRAASGGDDASTFLSSVAQETTEGLAQDAAVVLDSMQGVPQKTKDNALLAVESGKMQESLGPAINAAIVAGIAAALANPKVQQQLGVDRTLEAQDLKANPTVQAASRGTILRAPQASAVFAEEAQDLAEALDPNPEGQVVMFPTSTPLGRGQQISQAIGDATLAANTVSNAMVGTSDAAAQLAVAYKDLGGISGITGIQRADVDDAKKAIKKGYKDLSKQAGSAKTQIGKGASAAKTGIGNKSSAAYTGLKNKKASFLSSSKVTSAKSSASSAKSSASKRLSSAGGSASRRASSAKSSATSRARSAGSSLSKRAGGLKRRITSRSHYDVAMLVIQGEALELAMARGNDHPIGAAPGVTSLSAMESPEMVKTAFVEAPRKDFTDTEQIVDQSLREGVAIAEETGDVKKGFLSGYKNMFKRFLGEDGLISKAMANAQGGLVEKGGVVVQQVQLAVKRYWEKFLTDWLPYLKERVGEGVDVFLRDTLPALMKDLPQLLLQGVDTVAGLVNAVVSIVNMISNIVGAEMHPDPTFHMRVLNTFYDEGMDDFISGEADSFDGLFLKLNGSEVNEFHREQLGHVQEYIIGGGYHDGADHLKAHLEHVLPDLHSRGLFGNLFGGKKDKKEIEELKETLENATPVLAPVAGVSFPQTGRSGILSLLRSISIGENGFSRSSDALRGYAEDLAAALTLQLSQTDAVTRKEMTRTLIIFFTMIVNHIGDLNAADKSRPLEDQAASLLATSIDSIAQFQLQRERTKQMLATAQRQEEIAQLEDRLRALRPESDALIGGTFGSILGTFKGAFKGKKKKENAAETAKLTADVEAARQKAIQQLQVAANNPQNRVSNALAAASRDLLGMAYADASSTRPKVWNYMDELIRDAVGGDYQGRDANEQILLQTTMRLMSATLLFFMNAEGDWTDANLALLVQTLDSPIHQGKVSYAIGRLRKYADARGVRTDENEFEINRRRQTIAEKGGAQAADVPVSAKMSVSDMMSAMSLVGQHEKDIPHGSSVHFVGSVSKDSMLVAIPGSNVVRSQSGHHYRMSGGKLTAATSKSASPLLHGAKDGVHLRELNAGKPMTFEQRIPVFFYEKN